MLPQIYGSSARDTTETKRMPRRDLGSGQWCSATAMVTDRSLADKRPGCDQKTRLGSQKRQPRLRFRAAERRGSSARATQPAGDSPGTAGRHPERLLATDGRLLTTDGR
jgi:hypothetical protein